MTGPRSAEERISLWLEQEAVGLLPDRVLDATFEETRDLRQASRSGWRPFSMSRPIPALIAVGAAAIVIVVGAILLRPAPSSQVGGGGQPVDFTSPQFGYTMEVPGSWNVTPASSPWPAGQRIESAPTSVDVFRIRGTPDDPEASVASQPAPDGTTSATWLTEWERIRDDIGGHCFGNSSGWLAATVAGLPGWHVKWRCDSPQDQHSNWDEYTFLAGGMGYVITGTPSMVDTIALSIRIPTASSPGAIKATGTPVAKPIDTSSWVTYASSQYAGLLVGRPQDWNVDPADRAWTYETDGRDWLSPATDDFTAPEGDVRVSVWKVDVDAALETGPWDDLIDWYELTFCPQTGGIDCTIHAEPVRLCVELRDCHPGVLLPSLTSDQDTRAFFTGGIAGDGMTVVTLWRPENDPSVARYGGARALLEAFLSTTCVYPKDSRPPFGTACLTRP